MTRPDEALVERVALAICKVSADEGYTLLCEESCDVCRTEARAAIAAYEAHRRERE